MAQDKKIHLLVGTHKGGFRFTSKLDRKGWQLHGPYFKGADVHSMVFDARPEPTIFACVNNAWWGPKLHFSKDLGANWQEPAAGIRFDEESDQSDQKIEKIWCVEPGQKNEPGVLYAGAAPGTLFKSEDGGDRWFEITSLRSHPTREKWQPGAGGMMVHSICLHPENSYKMHIGVSAAGHFYTDDGGETWEPRNKGVLADFLPEKYPEVGQCVHHLQLHPDKPDVLYQQNHCGVYRSDNGGRDWLDLCEGLPSRFGFPLQIHSHDPDTIYVVPEESPDFRCPVDGAFAVFRSRNRGEQWERLDNGLPNKNAYFNVYRQAMCADTCEPCGIYLGTSTGQIFYSRDQGDSWEILADCLPPVFSLACAELL